MQYEQRSHIKYLFKKWICEQITTNRKYVFSPKDIVMKVKTQELFNFYSHLAGMIAAVIGTVYLAMVASH